jgi:hypothetical protein
MDIDLIVFHAFSSAAFRCCRRAAERMNTLQIWFPGCPRSFPRGRDKVGHHAALTVAGRPGAGRPSDWKQSHHDDGIAYGVNVRIIGQNMSSTCGALGASSSPACWQRAVRLYADGKAAPDRSHHRTVAEGAHELFVILLDALAGFEGRSTPHASISLWIMQAISKSRGVST